MKRISIIIISLIILLILIFVFVRPKQDIVSVRLLSEATEITYTDSGSLQIFEDALRTAKKVRGAVDVAEPTFRMTVTYADSETAGFSLYIDLKTKTANLIKDSNTERMLHIREKNAEQLADLLSKMR